MNLDFSKYIHDKKILLITGFILFICLLTVFFLSVLANSGEEEYVAIPPTAAYVPDQLSVTYRDGYAPHELTELRRKDLEERLSELGVTSQERLYYDKAGELGNHYVLYLREGTDIAELQEQLGKFDEIGVSEPNFVIGVFATPNDPRYSEQWGMNKISAPQAWDSATGDTNTVVAVIDSGIDSTHPDLSINTISGRNFLNDNVSDDLGHGTHVAGIIGAVGNNGVGVAGVNWGVSLMPLRVCFATNAPAPNNNGCETLALSSAVIYAVDNGADVINMSIGGQSGCSAVSQLHIAIQYALARGVVVVVAAGNNGGDASSISPASCEGVITVGAIDENDRRSVWASGSASNYGSIVDIAAPGTSVLSTMTNGGYKNANGTSMAAPHVAGAAALLLSVNPSLSPQQVASCLIDNADQISTDRNVGPRLNVARALSSCSDLTGEPLPTTTSTPTIRYAISGRIFQDNNGNGQYDSGDLGLVNQTLNLTGSFSDSTTTITGGIYVFDNLFPGTYNVSYEGTTRNSVALSDQNPTVEGLNFVVTKSIINPTPTINVEPIVTSIPPTPTITTVPSPTTTSLPSATSVPAPTVAPIFFDCRYDPSCSSEQKNIRLCALICTPRN